jgi:DNA-binding MarR family transcriptional regulator
LAQQKKAPRNTAEVEHLDPMHSIGYLARINFRAFSAELEKLTITQGVTSGQWRFLRVLWEEDDITQRELSDRVGIKEATTVRAVHGLVESGLAVRHRSTSDRRKSRIKLTNKARTLKGKLLPMVSRVNERAVAGLSRKDIETTRRVLARTYENLVNNAKES